jgi:hypothetical protein
LLHVRLCGDAGKMKMGKRRMEGAKRRRTSKEATRRRKVEKNVAGSMAVSSPKYSVACR